MHTSLSFSVMKFQVMFFSTCKNLSALSPYPQSAGCVITISFQTTIGLMSSSSTYDSTEVVIQDMIDECQRNLDEQYDNVIANEYLKFKMKTLQVAPRVPKKLERLLRQKEKECENARSVLDIERLIAEIEVLKVIQYLVNRNRRIVKAK
jgi:hypothetical protein